MKTTLWLILIGILSGCSVSKKLTEKQSSTTNASTLNQVKEVITEPLISYIEVPVDCPENQDKPSPDKIYEIQSGPTHIKARLQGNTLRIKAENKGRSSKESVIEKIVTVDKIHYRDKVKTVRISYIPKWVWVMLIFNVIYFGWTYKSLFIRFLSKLLWAVSRILCK